MQLEREKTAALTEKKKEKKAPDHKKRGGKAKVVPSVSQNRQSGKGRGRRKTDKF